MSDPISRFFEAWKVEEAVTRLEIITGAVTSNIEYDDPRTPETIKGINALSDYVGMFSANAPGWEAKVVNCDFVGGVTRATVSFGGMGPDGKAMLQLGQYFVEQDGDRVSRMVGFVGLGEQK